MNDRELLELAAKAAGIELIWKPNTPVPGSEVTPYRSASGVRQCRWNPLTDDGDCARLEVSLELQIDIGDLGVLSERADGISCLEQYADHNGDRNSARRRASVRAAAEIGKAM